MALGSPIRIMVNQKNKLIGTQIEDKTRFVIESSKVMKSHFCRTQTRRRYVPVRAFITDCYMEFQNYAGTRYNIGTHVP